MQAIIFDLYGTLLERPKDLFVYPRLFQDATDPKLAKNLALIHNHTLGSLATTLGVKADISALEVDLREEVAAVRPYVETHHVLSKLKEKGMKLGLISNLATPYKEPFFREGLDHYFDTLVFSCDEGMKKPQQEIYLLACERLTVRPSDATMVGDSLICDYNGALTAGLKAILLDRTGEREDSLPSLLKLL
jgi:HAD superfamily hydrolase (TIGR01549 family)